MTPTPSAGPLSPSSVRPQESWGALGGSLDALGLDELHRRKREAVRLLEADGVTYNVAGRSTRSPQRWALDPLPVVIDSDEWAGLEGALIQRAELLDLILADLYGQRLLLRRGLLPPELIFGHPGFLRACDQVRLPTERQLFTYAADLARTPRGEWLVLADRTQVPSGAGYALENRIVVSRVFPSLYREAQVHRLAPFFRALRATLSAVAPPGVDDPRVVVLSPGPWSETAFEHAYLASYLGYTLVQGSDLLVRDGQVWLRSLGRLEAVHVILRRVDADYCDALELHPDSTLGVPGLVEATRRGTVSVVNTLGSGVLENPGLLAFLPDLARPLLGRPLQLASAPTWWCGDRLGLSHVLANLDSLVVKPLDSRAGRSVIFGDRLDRDQLDELRRRIEARPAQWAAQESVEPAVAPTLADDGIAARRMVLRAFAVARGDSYVALPGGLTRVAPDEDTAVIANQLGALSKDTWVLASEPEAFGAFWLQSSGLAAVSPVALVSSRAAENLFWMGRYAERAEDTVRLLRVVYDRRNDFAGGSDRAGRACLDTLLAALTTVTATYPGFTSGGFGAGGGLAGGGFDSDTGAELASLVGDDERSGTVAFAVRRLLDNMSAVRDQLSGDTWLVVGDLDRELTALQDGAGDRQAAAQRAVGRIMASLLALAGLAGESMVRDAGWQFLDAGRRIERALQLIGLLRATLTVERDTATDSLLLESVLTTAESIITYRRRYRSRAQLETVLDLLLLDEGNPRSLVYQVSRLAEDVAAMPTSTMDAPRRLSAEARSVLEASTLLRLADTRRLARVDPASGQRADLAELLTRLDELLTRTSVDLDNAHFTHLLPQRALFGAVAPEGNDGSSGSVDTRNAA